MSDAQRVVFDCNIYIQALARPLGPSGRCVSLALNGDVALFVSPTVLAEISDVATRPELVAKFRLRPQRLETLLESLTKAAVILEQVPEIWTYDRDPSDAHYVNLAIAAAAHTIVSRDNDLLDLMDTERPAGVDFRNGFPQLKIVDPQVFLRSHEPSES